MVVLEQQNKVVISMTVDTYSKFILVKSLLHKRFACIEMSSPFDWFWSLITCLVVVTSANGIAGKQCHLGWRTLFVLTSVIKTTMPAYRYIP